jgi:4-hydroxy-tetrahydrodipicolinate reductase
MNIFISGRSGRMGHSVEEEISKIPNYSVVDELDDKVSVIIDFSNHSVVVELLKQAVGLNIPVVIGTTALNGDDIEAVHAAAAAIPVFISANMSTDVAMLKKLATDAATSLAGDHQVSIIEAHHKNKLDSPSGTALMLKVAILDKLHDKNPNIDIDIEIESIREGDIPGEHTIIFSGNGEKLELKHTAYNRTIFATGAIKAAQFIVNQKPGLYEMDSLIF